MRDMWIGWDDKFPSILEQDHVAPPNTSYKNWIHLREVDPSAPDFKKLAEDLAVVLDKISTNTSNDEGIDLNINIPVGFGSFESQQEFAREALSTYRAAVGK